MKDFIDDQSLAPDKVSASLKMVNSCVAYNCTNRVKPGSGISFHHFPKNEERRQKWIQAVCRKNWMPSQNSYICSVHFESKCVVIRPGKKGHRLYDDAVPTVFDFPQHLQSNVSSRKPPKKRILPVSATEVREAQPSPSKVARAIGEDHSYSSMEEVQPQPQIVSSLRRKLRL